MTVLLIDPDTYWGELCASWLREDGHRVILAGDGLSGLRQLFNHHPDAAIVDVTPSGSDRWDTVQRIREVSNMPVIVISATADEVSLKKGFDLGVDGYIVKPFEQSELLERLAAVLRRVYNSNGHNGTIFHQDGLAIDWRSHEVRVDESGPPDGHRIQASLASGGEARLGADPRPDPVPRLGVQPPRRQEQRQALRLVPPPEDRAEPCLSPLDPHQARDRVLFRGLGAKRGRGHFRVPEQLLTLGGAGSASAAPSGFCPEMVAPLLPFFPSR
jgi:CheY-like chemotaxis protein